MPVTLAEAQVNVQDDVDFNVIDELRRLSWLLDQITIDDSVSPGTAGATLPGGTGSDWCGGTWNEGAAPVTVTDFGQLGPNPPPGALGEFLGIEVDDLDNVSDFTVSQSGSDSIVSINGQQVATLKDVEYAALKDCLAFYPGRVACFVEGEPVTPQPGRFYGGWITRELVGPFKGDPGSEDW